MTEIESLILQKYCEASVDIMDSDGVLSSVIIAKVMNITLYKARKTIKALVAKGYLQRDYVGGFSECDLQVYCYHGFSITKRAKKTLEYRKAKYREAKICSEICGYGSMWDYYKTI